MYGCYDSDNVSSELAENKLDPKPSSDPLDQSIYEFFETSNSTISYQYDTLEYQWNFNRNHNIYVLQENREYLLNGVKFINKVFGDAYSEDFKKKHFPPRIFLADSLNIGDLYSKILDMVSTSGNNHIAIGRIRENLENLSIADLTLYKADINATFWGGYLYNNDKLHIPDAFFDVCKDRYDANFKYAGAFPEFKGLDRDEIDTKLVGFWGANPATTDDWYYMSPTESVDIYQYIFKITSTDIGIIQPILDTYPKMKEKYTILTEYIKKDFGIDLQEIGNNK